MAWLGQEAAAWISTALKKRAMQTNDNAAMERCRG